MTVHTGLYLWRLTGQNKCACAVDGLPPASLSPQQPFHSNPCLLLPNMPWKRKRCWTADALCRLDSSFAPQCAQPVQGWLSQSAAPSGESSEQSRLALLARNGRNRMRDPPDSRTRRLAQQVSVPWRVGPCRHRCLSTNSAGSQIECLRLGAQPGQTAPVPGEQTVSTAQNRISGN